ncbi:hypothetical protein SESBI_27956 [Sesbania bispinosa]|nr:hypothetical protein SESBI_27956 [Sesbania bispinosa]
MATVWWLLEVMVERWGAGQRQIVKYVGRRVWLIIGCCRSRCRLLDRCDSDWWLRMVKDGRAAGKRTEVDNGPGG